MELDCGAKTSTNETWPFICRTRCCPRDNKSSLINNTFITFLRWHHCPCHYSQETIINQSKHCHRRRSAITTAIGNCRSSATRLNCVFCFSIIESGSWKWTFLRTSSSSSSSNHCTMPFNRFTPAGINVKSRWNIFPSTNFITEQPNGIHLQSKTAKWIVYWWWTRIDRNIVLYYFPREMVLGRNGWRSLVGGDRKMITKLRGEIERTNWTNRIFLFATSACSGWRSMLVVSILSVMYERYI